MAEEIQEAIQIIRVGYEGVELAMKIGSGGLNSAKKVLDVLKGLIDWEKSIGKTSMRTLLMKGGDLQVFQFDKKDQNHVQRMLKKYGISYSVLPEINKSQGLVEIAFHSEAVPRINMMVSKMKMDRAKVATFDDYLKEGNGDQLNKLMKFFKDQKKGNDLVHTEEDVALNKTVDSLLEKVGMFAMEKKTISVDSVKEKFSISDSEAQEILRQLEVIGAVGRDDKGNRVALMDGDAFKQRIGRYQGLANRMKSIELTKDRQLSDITISKTLVVEENERAVKTRVPGTWGDNVRFLWVSKENAMEINGGKTILTFIDKDKEYKLYDESNHVVEKKKGTELYDKHYDSVEIGVRDRYEKMKKDKEHRERIRAEARANRAAKNAGRKK